MEDTMDKKIYLWLISRDDSMVFGEQLYIKFKTHSPMYLECMMEVLERRGIVSKLTEFSWKLDI